MIDEAIGKILGMAMAYAVSGLGLFLAYANYRRRTVGAATVMTPKAWGVVALVVLAIAGGVAVVGQLARRPQVAVPAPPASEDPGALAAEAVTGLVPTPARTDAQRERWPLVGIVLPAAIFLVATWVTGALYLRFSRVDASAAADEPPPAG
jgi:hypothetical protein